jgi:signal recognition particle GTPase
MFDNLSDRLNSVFKKLKGHGKLKETNIEEGLKEVRMALLEADVHYKVVKKICWRYQKTGPGSGSYGKLDARSAGCKNS